MKAVKEILYPELLAIAGQFQPLESISTIEELGSGNVNDTFLVTLDRCGENRNFVLQRINSHVFNNPENVILNLKVVGQHIKNKLTSNSIDLSGRRWEVPILLTTLKDQKYWVRKEEQIWRAITFINNASTIDVLSSDKNPFEIGYGLGMFHYLINDLSTNEIEDTLPEFHVTPSYLREYDFALSNFHQQRQIPSINEQKIKFAMDFITKHRQGADVLEEALRKGELKRRPIHGDPKINNIMFDTKTNQAVGLIDLDTVSPGLIHYDIGDCLRSCCNQAGEESEDLEKVFFNLSICEDILGGYLSIAKEFLSEEDYLYIPFCIKLITFELGLRFFTDHLNGDIYFKTKYPGHNLHRARVQFHLTESIAAQWGSMVNLISRLRS